MNADEREHWMRLMLQRSSQGEPLVRPTYCPLLSVYPTSTLARLVKTGEVPTLQIGKSVYVVNSVIADWIIAQNMRRHHSVSITPIQEKTNHDPSRGHPMDDLPDDSDQEFPDP